jgi:putative flippase GtrA
LTRRWLRFMATLIITALLNEGVFLIVYHRLPVIIASLLASSVIALLNYTLSQRFIFSH